MRAEASAPAGALGAADARYRQVVLIVRGERLAGNAVSIVPCPCLIRGIHLFEGMGMGDRVYGQRRTRHNGEMRQACRDLQAKPAG
jgi:hypothetical protein